MLTGVTFGGVKVLELAQYIFVPGAGTLLADFGADVIHVETVDGDPYRRIRLNDGRNVGETNLAIEQNNRGKRSLCIDLKSAEGREVFLRLVEDADVFMTSLRPQAIDKLGLGVEALRARNPRLIYVRGNGLGFRGEEAGKAGLDGSAFWARGGFAHLLTPPEATRLQRARSALGDHAGSVSLAFGIAAALFRRERTGEPSVIESSLLATAMWILSSDVVAALNNPDYDDRGLTRNDHEFPLLRAYRTRDGRWVQLMMMDADRFWPQFCELLGIAECAQDARFATETARIANGQACTRIIAETIAARDWDEWRPLFAQLDGPWELAATVQEVMADPQAEANGYIFEAGDGERVSLVAGPVTIDGKTVLNPARAPEAGQHTDEILREAAFSEREIAALRARQVIA
jgi:crotonobetainyl-CoA:carnitine CoA-transferase CaiB-like acyl-CoA transferase